MLIELLLIELFTLNVRLPYTLFKEFKLLGYSNNERARDMELWMIERENYYILLEYHKCVFPPLT